jgi:uncharacterized protein with HEPN domain
VTRDAGQRAADIQHAIERCQRHIDVLDSKEPDLVDIAEDALERNVQIIGEATNHLPVEITDAHPEIPWPQSRGFRNILVHQYFGVDVQTIREVIEKHLSPLGAVLREHLNK